jgi:hypothetical protein
MAHISSISSGLFSALAINKTPILNITSADTLPELRGLFANVADFVQVNNVREFPQMGTPANIVNVPVYGQKTSSQIQGQADAPNLELTLNYVPSEWATGTQLGDMVGDGNQYAFQFSLLNAKPGTLAATVGGLGVVRNSNFYFVGKIEALLVSPQLTDANQATLTLSIQGDFFGPDTV